VFNIQLLNLSERAEGFRSKRNEKEWAKALEK